MKLTRYSVPAALATFLLTLAARPCGPDFPDAVFVLQSGPGGNYASYAAGHVGIPQSGYRTRHMVIAYEYLSGHPLPAEVQKQALAINSYLLDPWQADDDSKPKAGYASWLKARSGFGAVDGFIPDEKLRTERNPPGEDYNQFTNCLDDAFANAAKTLAARIAAYGAKDSAVMEWVRGQDAVFTNCGDGKARDYFGPPDKAPAPPPQPHAPMAPAANAPLWLQKDRAYQQAAASFYALQYDDAVAVFRAIAADGSSPWSATARYMVARAYIRSATVPAKSQGDVAERAADKRRYADALTKAQRELVAMQAEPRMAAMRPAIDGLLDYVNLRLQPEAQAAVLAVRLQAPNVATFPQAVRDLTWLHSSDRVGEDTVPAVSSSAHPNDMLAWIDAFYKSDAASALAHWRSTRSTAWLVVAMANVQPGDAAAPELVSAAKAVPATDAGWLAVTYHRLRLSPRDAAMRQEALALLPQIRRSGDVSATNLFLGLSTATAPSLNDWLATVARVPAGENDSDGEETLPNAVAASTDDAAGGTPPATVEDDCGKKFPAETVLPLFDTDAAVALNRQMPLRVLAQAAESTTLPEGLRFQVAQATWARAVLLDRPEIAHRMTPILVGCRAAWSPVLAAYDSATTAEARHAAGLLALMRFASTVPSVWDGEDRRGGFATYDEFRENWWCTAVPKPGQTVDADPDMKGAEGDASSRASGVQRAGTPLFLTAADVKDAAAEVAALERIPRASTYFAQQALAWQKVHPADPRTPDIVGEAERVVRNSCRKEAPTDGHGVAENDPADMNLTGNLAKALFEMLQRSYPTSRWATLYTSWE